MKKIYSAIIGVIAAISLVCSCDGLNEVDYTYLISSENFYNSPEEAEAAMNAVYNKFRGSFNSNWFAQAELDAEYGYSKGVYMNQGMFYEGIWNATSISRCAANWQNLYQAVNYCNMAIKGMASASKMTDAQITSFTAEARFLRAIAYFSIVRRWGGVPLRTDENIAQWDLEKSSEKEVYDFIVRDLEFAIDNCLDESRLIGTPNKTSAKAVLAEVLMYTKDYQRAASLAKDVINSGKYSLVQVSKVRDFDNLFGYDLVTSTEEIFYIKTSRTDNLTWDYLTYTAHTKYTIDGKPMLNGSSYYTHYLDTRNKTIADWDKNDLRYGLNVGEFVFGADTYGEYTALFTKFWDPLSSSGRANVNIPLFRLADTYLVYAEATARVNGGKPTAESIEYLNKLRRRGYGRNSDTPDAELDYKLKDYPTWEDFQTILINEETYEQMNEAKHWFFLVRLGHDVAQEYVYRNALPGKDPVTINEKHWLWQIPDAEFNYNKALDKARDQNPGYNDNV